MSAAKRRSSGAPAPSCCPCLAFLGSGGHQRSTGVAAVVRQRIAAGAGDKDTVDLATLIVNCDPARQVTKHYKIVEQLGSGAFGAVFLASHKATGQERAIKQIQKTSVEEDMEFVYAELEAAIKLDHPNVCRFYEFFEDNNLLYLVTEVCYGGDFGELNQTIKEPEEIRILIKDLVMAVAYCHDHGVAHRDLKFENCLIQKKPKSRRVAKVIDFGLAAIRRPGDKVGKWLNDQLGTRYFVAPEVVDSNKAYGVKCDCWSMGVMIYIVLTDEHPISSQAHSLDTNQLFRKVLYGMVRDGPLDAAGVEPEARDLILKLLIKDPAQRLDARSALNHRWLKKDSGTPVGSWASKSYAARHPKHAKSPSSSPLDKQQVARIRKFQDYTVFEKAILTLVAHNADSRAVDDLRQTFMQLDTECSGTLSPAELRKGLTEMGQVVDEDDLKSLFDSLDQDKTGKVKYTEFLAATMKPKALASDTVLKQVFSHFDLDQTGYVSKDELRQVLGSDEAVKAALEHVPVENDGELSMEEFKDVMLEIARKMDNRERGRSRMTTRMTARWSADSAMSNLKSVR